MKEPEFVGNTPRDLQTLKSWCARRNEAALDPELPIIDSHHHFYDDERGRFLLAEMQEEVGQGHNIVATVYLQHKAGYRQDGPVAMRPVGEVAFAAEIARQSREGATRFCAGIVGHADLTLGEGVRDVLEAMGEAGEGRFKGVRHGATWDDGRAAYGRTFAPRHLLLTPEFRRGFAQLAPMGLSFDAWIYHPQLPDLMDLLTSFPETPVVLNHCGGVLGVPPYTDRAAVHASWSAAIRKLAGFPNLSVKLGGLGMLYGGAQWHLAEDPPDSSALATAWRPYIETCIEAFGPDRAMFESNFPVDKQSCGYGVLWNAFKRVTVGYSPSERADLFHGTASRFYRLG
ncbi:amidohydrolase [Bordetella sp. N]|uniref:amidohydrolase family protein n=1 Tax=Bordetella sp. N TaxID=1746199 RepID=UPI00070F5499|nr:amidohydrolase family protein [Bordetella sp. N]ALM84235.1 hypothetical protein ASB57_15765 [Bordetella sp. N]